MTNNLMELGHYYVSEGITEQTLESIRIGDEYMYQNYGAYEKMLFVDDVHTIENASIVDPYRSTMIIQTACDYLVLESEMEKKAEFIFRYMPDYLGGHKIRHKDKKMTCLAMDFALCLFKYDLGYKHSHICMHKSFEKQQNSLHDLIVHMQQTNGCPRDLQITSVLFDDDFLYLITTTNGGTEKNTQ